MTKVAFIGLGNMGGPQARQIARGTFDLSVYDAFPAALAQFEGLARLATSPKDAAQDAEIVCVCVRDDDQVRSVLYGNDGAAAGIAPGGLIVIHSTIRASTLRAIRQDMAERGLSVIDAAVSNTRKLDDGRFVVSIVGGDDEEVARARPVLEAFSTSIEHVGPAGAGMAAKIANNMVTWTHIIVGMQATAMALESGVSLGQLRAILKANGNLTPAVASLLEGRFAADLAANPVLMEHVRSQTGIGQKDLTLAAESLVAAGLDPQLVIAGRELVSFAMTGSDA